MIPTTRRAIQIPVIVKMRFWYSSSASEREDKILYNITIKHKHTILTKLKETIVYDVSVFTANRMITLSAESLIIKSPNC